MPAFYLSFRTPEDKLEHVVLNAASVHEAKQEFLNMVTTDLKEGEKPFKVNFNSARPATAAEIEEDGGGMEIPEASDDQSESATSADVAGGEEASPDPAGGEAGDGSTPDPVADPVA